MSDEEGTRKERGGRRGQSEGAGDEERGEEEQVGEERGTRTSNKPAWTSSSELISVLRRCWREMECASVSRCVSWSAGGGVLVSVGV